MLLSPCRIAGPVDEGCVGCDGMVSAYAFYGPWGGPGWSLRASDFVQVRWKQ